MRTALLLIPFLVAGCDSSDAVDGGPDDAGSVDAGTVDAGGHDAGMTDGGGGFTLLINNFLTQCNVTENGATSSPTKDFPPGTVVTLQADPTSGHVWGYWIGTDADNGSPTHDTSMTASATMNANKTVLACCPMTTGQTCP